jgi:broad specificity phosphatase PhoE
VHKAQRGLLPGDETIEAMGKRILAVASGVATAHPGETAVLVSHADPLIAAWIVLDRRPQNEREMHRKPIDKAGMLRVEMDGATATSWEYIPPPRVDRPASAAA